MEAQLYGAQTCNIIVLQGAVMDLNCKLSSGAPPVRSRVLMLPGLALRSAMQRSAVRRSIISLRSGELSTWQCEQAWLQYRPMLSCSVVAGSLLSGRTRCSCIRQAMCHGSALLAD